MPLLFGVTSAGVLVPIRVDVNGLLETQSMGYIGGAWQKDPIREGYSGDQSEQILNSSAAAGDNTLTSTAVPAGEIWRVQAVDSFDTNNNLTDLWIYVVVNGVTILLMQSGALTAGNHVLWHGEITLSQGDTVNALLRGCTLNDDIYLRYHAVRVDIDL